MIFGLVCFGFVQWSVDNRGIGGLKIRYVKHSFVVRRPDLSFIEIRYRSQRVSKVLKFEMIKVVKTHGGEDHD